MSVGTRIPSHMSHTFSNVPRAEIPRSVFSRPYSRKMTLNSGFLYPFLVDEVLPGDTFSVDATLFARLLTPLRPFMDNLFMDTFYFYIPNRLTWDNWEKFMGERTPDPDSSIDYLVPQVNSHATNGWAEESLFDYLGLPIGTKSSGHTACAFWSRGYNLCFNHWFRDQNLQDSLVVDTDDGPDSYLDYNLKRRGKRHDYFTSALPFAQKGDAVDLPLGTSAPVLGIASSSQTFSAGPLTVYESDGTSQSYANYVTGATVTIEEGGPRFGSDNFSGVFADLTNATAATINSLRQAFQIQRLLERDARGGTRYTELIKAHFGVTSPDARLQRPEFLGGKSTMIQVNPVAATTYTGDSSPVQNVGFLGATAQVVVNKDGFTKSFTEHGIILGLVSIRADLTYQQGKPRMFSRSTRYDFFWPAFSHLGEQAILNQEIFAQAEPANHAANIAAFGYQERWAEYRYKPSEVCGLFRSEAVTPLDVWHLAQDFQTLPVLGDTFIQETPPVQRVVAVVEDAEFQFDSFIKMRCVRPMPTFSVPGLIDHF